MLPCGVMLRFGTIADGADALGGVDASVASDSVFLTDCYSRWKVTWGHFVRTTINLRLADVGAEWRSVIAYRRSLAYAVVNATVISDIAMTRLPLIAALTLLVATPALAQSQSYAMMLGNRQLGTLAFDGSGSNVHLLSRLDNTPLGVADGTFEATTRADGDTVAYLGQNRGSKTRDIAITRQGPAVNAVTVTPSGDATDLSDPASVPAGTLTTAEVFGQLANGKTCPNPMAMYDGRRVVQLATTAIDTTGDTVTCTMSYRVIAGKGHLSPFNFKSLAMTAIYQAGALAQVTVSAGGFDVTLVRQ